MKRLGERALNLPAPHNPLWADAARFGLADPELREAADTCFAAALDALPRLGATTRVTDAVAAYRDRYVARGRCPADDLLDRLPVTAPPSSGSGPDAGTRTARGRKDIRT